MIRVRGSVEAFRTLLLAPEDTALPDGGPLAATDRSADRRGSPATGPVSAREVQHAG
ncbi:hypothetical protein [Geothrix sp.]|jgi:hypothetical protein|uniref:hypothetical protein n=1 Tax=Geothrix sp. TaxID=1962974 RepID=UPI0025C5DBFC|nr:hypothetical protein [Geothrix sp.]